MNIYRIIQRTGLIAILSLGTVFTASAHDVDNDSELFDATVELGGHLLNNTSSALIQSIARNPSLMDELKCIAVVNYKAALDTRCNIKDSGCLLASKKRALMYESNLGVSDCIAS